MSIEISIKKQEILKYKNIFIYYRKYLYIQKEYMFTIQTGDTNPILRNTSEEIQKNEWSQFAKIGKEMVKYIKNPLNGGVGLAAPQVWYSKRMLVATLLKNWEDEYAKTLLMMNPRIIEKSKEMTKEVEEWCLSVPKGKRGYVLRHSQIKVEFFDENMKKQSLRLSGIASVIVQHEIDHLDGILYTDKVV